MESRGDVVKMEQLNEGMERRQDFNALMRERVYGGEVWEQFDEFSTEKATVWIDPLDGTKDFCNGNLSAVTVLIGLSIDGVPKLGVVHNPFKTNDNDGKGMTLFGSQEHGAYLLEYDKAMSPEELDQRAPAYLEPFDPEGELAEDFQIRVACSLTHFNQQMQDTIDTLSPVEICRLGGAGNKVNRVALNEVDSYVQPRAGLRFWDLCAPECIVRAMGGLCTDFEQQRLVYDEARNNNRTVLAAFFIGKTLTMHALIQKRLAAAGAKGADK